MIYTIRHRTTYRYEKPVGFARCVLRLVPLTSDGQTLLGNHVTVSPQPSSAVDAIGPFGERKRTIIIDRPHNKLVIETNSRIDVQVPEIGDRGATPWEEVRTQAFEARGLGPDDPSAYLYPTRRTPLAATITDYARSSFSPGRSLIEAGIDLMTRIRTEFTYDPSATTVSTPALQAFEERHGVCQDFAHVMICGVRGLGLPAAYVSGYLRTNPPPGRPRLEGADATHAWVALWCGEDCGWIGFDPTNAVLAGNDHIVLATGRDYSDVAPIDGIILAPGGQDIDVEVTVVPEDELMPERIAAYQ